MNIFVTSADPVACAKYLDDKRLVKMCLETAQILSTSLSESGSKGPYRTTHKNHPCCVWARETRGNYLWLVSHFKALCNEYTLRYGKTHACQSHLETFVMGQTAITMGGLTQFINCTIFKDEPDVHTAYKLHLASKWPLDARAPLCRVSCYTIALTKPA